MVSAAYSAVVRFCCSLVKQAGNETGGVAACASGSTGGNEATEECSPLDSLPMGVNVLFGRRVQMDMRRDSVQRAFQCHVGFSARSSWRGLGR